VVYCVKGGSVSQSVTENLTRAQVNVRYIEGGLKAGRNPEGVWSKKVKQSSVKEP